ncbi:MAG: hypothetical protein M1577_03750 [Chloroflexi bacterium]|nr:hypothetical protein [Chloroflexota bacterium]
MGQGTPSEKVRITTDGNIGIGTTGPEAKLHVEGSVNPSILVKQTTPAKRAYYEVNSAGQLLSTDGDIQFQTNGGGWSIKMVLTNAGNVGIGTTNPAQKLDVLGNARISGNVEAANNVKVYDSGWFPISQLGETWKDHGLQTIPKGVTVLCAASATPTEASVAGPSVAHWHNWVRQGDPTQKGDDMEAFVRMTSTQVYVRAGDKVGWHSSAW